MTANVRKNGPIETVDAKGIQVRIYSDIHHGEKSFLVTYYAAGKRQRDRRPTLELARKHAKAKAGELASGTAHVRPLSLVQAATVQNVVELLQPLDIRLSDAISQFVEATRILGGNGTILDAAKFYALHQKKQEIPTKNFGEIVDEFLKHIEVTGLSQQYRRDCRARLQRAQKAFRSNIGDIPSSSISEWLSVGKRSPRTFNNDRNALVTLFSFARRKGYLPEDQKTAPERVDKRKEIDSEIQILTQSDYATLLQHTPTLFIPYVVLGGLAGLRTAEISRLHWDEIDLDEGHILIKAAKAKTASRRIVPVCEALKAWLLPLKQVKGPIQPYANEQSMMNRWSELKSNIPVHIPVNALRHSYASYRLALVEDAAKVALEMGNSPRKLFQNYRQLVTKRQAEQWFGTFPPHSEVKK